MVQTVLLKVVIVLGPNPFSPRVLSRACEYAKPEMESRYIAALRGSS